MSEITSVQNARIKRLVKLREDRAFRQQEGSVVVVGATLCHELTTLTPAIQLLVRGAQKEISGRLASEVTPVSDAVFKKVAGIATNETVIAEMPLPHPRLPTNMRRILALDGIADPGNLGTLLRTALAFGWDAALFLDGCVDPFNDKAIRASRGALFSLPYQNVPTEDLGNYIAGHNLTPYVAHIQGKSVTSVRNDDRILLVMGNEAHGPCSHVLATCTPVTIPICSKMESLNVASAGAILLHAFQNR